jgi:hypothetical protein
LNLLARHGRKEKKMADANFNVPPESGFEKIQRGLNRQNSNAPANMPDSLMDQWNEWSEKYKAAQRAGDYNAISETSYQLFALTQKAGPATAG